ncbi:MAG TPA: hypothetical protein DEV93_02150, partial [Chloroflexi bacterium]|nr:hypothetical protein [Chloroflexota bacterium]
MQDRAHAALVAGGVGQVGVGRLGRWTPVPGVLEGQQLGIVALPDSSRKMTLSSRFELKGGS